MFLGVTEPFSLEGISDRNSRETTGHLKCCSSIIRAAIRGKGNE